MNVLVTGTRGFIGQHIMQTGKLGPTNKEEASLHWLPYSARDLNVQPPQGFDAVVHCAGLAHQMTKVDDRKYFEVNHKTTLKMAELALKNGAKHFIFLSSSKVFGDSQHQAELTEYTDCKPSDAYGESKLRAELDLKKMNSDQFVVSIIRPPLVFGAGVKGNLIRLLRLVDSAWPLPFGNATAQRSMVNVDNLIALIKHLLQTPIAGVFHAGESTAPTVARLVCTMRQHLNRPTRLISLPKLIHTLGQKVVPAQMDRLFGGMLLSNTHTNRILGFEPPITFDVGIKKMVDWYRN